MGTIAFYLLKYFFLLTKYLVHEKIVQVETNLIPIWNPANI